MEIVITMRKTVGGEDRLPDDDGGHLIARMFGGSKDIDNLVAQSKFINRPFKENGEWYDIEKNGKMLLILERK